MKLWKNLDLYYVKLNELYTMVASNWKIHIQLELRAIIWSEVHMEGCEALSFFGQQKNEA